MMATFEIKDHETNKTVGTIIIMGNLGEGAFLSQLLGLLNYLSEDTKTNEEIQSLTSKVNKDE